MLLYQDKTSFLYNQIDIYTNNISVLYPSFFLKIIILNSLSNNIIKHQYNLKEQYNLINFIIFV